MINKYEKIKNILTSQEKFHISLGLERILKILDLVNLFNKIKIYKHVIVDNSLNYYQIYNKKY